MRPTMSRNWWSGIIEAADADATNPYVRRMRTASGVYALKHVQRTSLLARRDQGFSDSNSRDWRQQGWRRPVVGDGQGATITTTTNSAVHWAALRLQIGGCGACGGGWCTGCACEA
jgi:hypothetical protein